MSGRCSCCPFSSTNLLFNVIAAPGALLRYRQQGQLAGPLTRLLIAGTISRVVVGSVLRVFVASGPETFRVLAALVLLPIGSWLLLSGHNRTRTARSPSNAAITGLALLVGTVGGIYGTAAARSWGPILVGGGMAMSVVAPAALASTFITSGVGALTYALLALTASGDIAPNWGLGIACGLGGLIGGYLGARLQQRLPEAALRTLLGTLAIALGIFYLVMGLT